MSRKSATSVAKYKHAVAKPAKNDVSTARARAHSLTHSLTHCDNRNGTRTCKWPRPAPTRRRCWPPAPS